MAVNFDMDTDTLLALTQRGNTKQAYVDIRHAFERRGWSHSQYSGYMSDSPVTLEETLGVLQSIGEELPWFEPSLKKCHITVVGELFDYIEMLSELEDAKEAAFEAEATMTPAPDREPAQEENHPQQEEGRL